MELGILVADTVPRNRRRKVIVDVPGQIHVLDEAGALTDEFLDFSRTNGDFVQYDEDEDRVNFCFGWIGGVMLKPIGRLGDRVAFERDAQGNYSPFTSRWCPAENWLYHSSLVGKGYPAPAIDDFESTGLHL